jgi:hypothetical protein
MIVGEVKGAAHRNITDGVDDIRLYDLNVNGSRDFQTGNCTLTLYAKNDFFADAGKKINFTDFRLSN